MDLERLDEALKRTGIAEFMQQEETEPEDVMVVRAAARAYRDLLANGAEPDYEAALRKVLSWLTYLEDTDTPRDRGKLYAMTIEAVDAAIGDRLPVDHPEEGTE